MDYFATTRAMEDKLATLLDANGLLHTMDAKNYPITLTITQNKAADAQMELYAGGGGISSRDSMLRFIFRLEGLEIQTNERLVITDDLMSKIKGNVKKLHAEYLHAYFAATCTLGMNAISYGIGTETEVEDKQDPGAFDAFYEEEE